MAKFYAKEIFQFKNVLYRKNTVNPYELADESIVSEWVDAGLVVLTIDGNQHQTVPTYDVNGLLTKVEDFENGVVVKQVNYTYNPDGTLATVTTKTKGSGQTATYNYVNGKVSSITKEIGGEGL